MLKTNKEFTFEGKKFVQVYRQNYNQATDQACAGCSGFIDEATTPIGRACSAGICDEANKHDDCLENDLALIWIEEK